MKLGYAKGAFILGSLSVLGPFAVDMYLPALPDMTADLETTTSMTQMTLMVFFITLGLCQIVYGPLSDAWGRRKPLLLGGSVYAVATIVAYLAPTVEWLIAARFLQGIGAAAMMVIPRAIVRDQYTGADATRLIAMVMLVISVSPMLAPLTGSLLSEPFGWRSIFLVLTLASLFALGLVLFVLPETLVEEKRQPISWDYMGKTSLQLLRDKSFMGLTMVSSFGLSAFLSYLASASYLYIEHFGFTERQFSLAFAVNAIGFFSMSQVASSLCRKYGMMTVIRGAITGFFGVAMTLLLLTVSGIDGFFVLAGMMFITFAFLGLILPTAGVLALEQNGEIAGMASSLGGTIQMLTGAVVIAVVSLFFNGTSLPMVISIATCASITFVVSRFVLGREEILATT